MPIEPTLAGAKAMLERTRTHHEKSLRRLNAARDELGAAQMTMSAANQALAYHERRVESMKQTP